MPRLSLALVCLLTLLAPLGAIGKRYRYAGEAGVPSMRMDRWTGRTAVLHCVEVLPAGTPIPSTLPVAGGPQPSDPAARRCVWTDGR